MISPLMSKYCSRVISPRIAFAEDFQLLSYAALQDHEGADAISRACTRWCIQSRLQQLGLARSWAMSGPASIVELNVALAGSEHQCRAHGQKLLESAVVAARRTGMNSQKCRLPSLKRTFFAPENFLRPLSSLIRNHLSIYPRRTPPRNQWRRFGADCAFCRAVVSKHI
jgi:hypothetical protein